MARKNKAFVGTVYLKMGGKIYGATTRQVNAMNSISAINKLKKKFAYKGNTVTVKDIKSVKNIKSKVRSRLRKKKR